MIYLLRCSSGVQKFLQQFREEVSSYDDFLQSCILVVRISVDDSSRVKLMKSVYQMGRRRRILEFTTVVNDKGREVPNSYQVPWHFKVYYNPLENEMTWLLHFIRLYRSEVLCTVSI